jgi:hypothetical protein
MNQISVKNEQGSERSEAEEVTVSDFLLRRVSESRAGAEASDDYDVIGADGLVIGRVFRATTAPPGTPWLWTLGVRGARRSRPRAHARGRYAGIRPELEGMTNDATATR